MHTYNLILYHVPERQCISDFMTIRNIMVGRAPDIRVHVLSAASAVPADFWRMAAEKPSLIFSFAPLRLNTSVRGARFTSHSLTKLEEIELVTAAGFTVPETRRITPGIHFDDRTWGPFTVIKPNRGMKGRGVQLLRTKNVRFFDATKLVKDDPRHGHEFVAQRFIDTGPHVTCHRVMTLLGRPIYAATSIALEQRPALDSDGVEPLDVPIAANDMVRKITLCQDRDIIETAKSLHAALPHLPVMGVDIIREHGTGRLFVLEFNSHGLVWHLSSKLGFNQQRDNGIDFYGQFNALSTMADALIESTRSRAV